MKFDRIIAERPKKKIYLDGDRVIKLFDESYSTADVLNEALNLARVAETGLNVPKLHEVTKIDGKWAIITDYIEGKTMAQIMEENPAKLNELIIKFVDIQCDIHSRTAVRLSRLSEKMHNKIKALDLDATAKYELRTRINSIHEHTKLCHGDYNPSNVIITHSGDAYILDWAHATQGNASADAARTYLLFSLAGDTKSAELYMKQFCKKRDTARQYVQKWLSIVAATQMIKGNKDERDFLMRWVDVVEYE